jgi:hypothetical protein
MKKLIQNLLVFMILMSSTYAGLAQTQMSVRRIVHAGPTLQTLASAGTTHCAGTPGPNVFLTSSTTQTSYQLWRMGIPNIAVGIPVTGMGGAVNFGAQNDGTYFVIASSLVSPFCSDTMINVVTISSINIPTVNITASGLTTGCGSLTVTLSTPYEVGCTYQWQDNMVNIPFATATSYTATVNNTVKAYTCVATNSLGCSYSQTIVVTSHPLPQAFAVSTTTPTFCQGGIGGTVNLASSLTGVSYQLLRYGVPVGTPAGGSGLALAWSGLIDGNYTVVATDNTTNCTNTMTGSATLAMNPLPDNAIAISGPTSVCQGETVAFFTGSITNASSYTWSVPAGASVVTGQGNTSVTIQFNGTSGNVSVFGNNACGAGQPFNYPVTVNAAPILNATSTAADVCAGISATLNATATPIGTSFAWSNGGFGPSVLVTPTSTTTYYVTATGVNGCTSTDNVLITVHALPNVTLALSPTSECQNTYMVTLTGGAPLGGTYNGACVTTGTDNVYPNSIPVNTYPITYTYMDSWGCSNTSPAANFVINPIPNVHFNSFYSGTIIPFTEPAFIVASGVPVGGVYSGPGFSLVGTSYWFTAADAGAGSHVGTYTYTQPSTGCTASDIITYTIGTVGIDEVNAAVNAISIYPNPTSDNINLSGINLKQIKSLNIINLLGEVVYSTNINESNMVINVREFSSGTYFIRFIDADGVSISKKIMKNE